LNIKSFEDNIEYFVKAVAKKLDEELQKYANEFDVEIVIKSGCTFKIFDKKGKEIIIGDVYDKIYNVIIVAFDRIYFFQDDLIYNNVYKKNINDEKR
jgi:hypothetical protein